jgi:outer membrane protein OmpA-like peptidoglycan-associated protein/Tol biopolymer transport system component
MNLLNHFVFCKKYRKFSILFLIILFTLKVSGQEDYSRIDALIEDGNFDEAIQLGNVLLKDDPDNSELNFKLGYSYLMTAQRKVKSIPYLEKSVELLNKKNKKQNGLYFESRFYLGKAYHSNYEFKKAIQLFKELAETTKNNKLLEAINQEISQCEVGIKLMREPVKMQINNLGKNINSEYSDHSPIITADESVLIFTSRRKRYEGEKMEEDGQYNEDIYISYNENNSWQKARSISENINTDEHEATISISPDGNQIFIYSSKDAGTILVSYLTGDEWSVPMPLGENINTKYRETHASMSANGKYLYFTSDRPGGYGGLDIYVSEKQKDNTWGKAVNLGPAINTEFDEEGPFIHHDGISLYFSSKGHETMGGFDIFLSKKNEFGTWTLPENLGYPINTVDNDVFIALTPDGKRAYFSSYREDGFGNTDIYMMAMPEAEEKPVTVVKGKVITCNNQEDDIVITVYDSENDDLLGLYKPNSKTGKYLFILPRGRNYYAIYEVNGKEKHEEQFFISENSDFQVIYKTISLIKGSPCDNTIVKSSVQKSTDNIDLYTLWEKEEGVTVVENVIFRINSSQYDGFKTNLKKLAKYLKDNPQTKIKIVGYSDTQGPETYNLKLSERRAKVVYDYLLQLGVNEEQLSYKGAGIKDQISINQYKDGSYVWGSLPYNRRVEFEIVNDAGKKLKIVPVRIPVLYKLNINPEEIKMELARLDSVYVIQLGAFNKPVQREVFKNIKDVQMYYTGKWYKYSTGQFKKLSEAENELENIRALGYKDAYIRKLSDYYDVHKFYDIN